MLSGAPALSSAYSVDAITRSAPSTVIESFDSAELVERALSWLRRNRRLMAHYEALAIIAEGFAKLAMISIMLKCLTETKPAPTS